MAHADEAHLDEQVFCKHQVAGSKPVIGSWNSSVGELAEWVKAGALKPSECNKLQGFESSTPRQIQ